jgi:hypothetical protein
MKKIPIKDIKTAEHARFLAICWQSWQNTQVFSYKDCIEWAIYFKKLAKKFHLVKEFQENAII